MRQHKLHKFTLLAIIISIALIGCQSIAPNPVTQSNNQNNTESVHDFVEPTIEISPTEVIEVDEEHNSPLEGKLSKIFEVFWESRELIRDNFVEQPVSDEMLAQGAIDGLNVGFDNLGLDASDAIPLETSFTIEEFSDLARTPKGLEDLFVPFWELWQSAQYVAADNEISAELMMQFALAGMADSLGDLHTSYMDPDQFKQTQISLNGEYEGIGAWVDTTTEYLTIVTPMPGSPAEAAGLLPGDAIIAVDGEDMTGIDGNLVIRRVLGPAGTKVVFTISREGVDEPFQVEVIRAKIVVPSIQYEVYENDIAYLRLFNFGSDTPNAIHEALKEIMNQNPVGLILDLRSNGGGFLTAAVAITSEFIDDGVILIEKYGDGSEDVYDALKSSALAANIPLVVLIDPGTASASEILAGAVRDHERGILVGKTSYGKGSVQLPFTLSNEQGSLRVTIAKWLTPDGNHIHGIGLEPDVFVDFTQEDAEAGIDPQLEKAIELLLAP